MDLRLIISTFFVIFMAELGDKTQFAAMAASAGSNKPLSILIGAVLALTLSSVIAVAAGGLIGNLIPTRYIKLAAGILFIIFGLLYIRESFTSEKTPESTSSHGGILKESILKAAEIFEEEELHMMIAAKDEINNVEFKTIFDNIIKQEKSHLRILKKISENDSELTNDEIEMDIHTHSDLGESFSCSDEDDQTLAELHKREQAMADFYRIMAAKNKIPSAKSAFIHLYHEEKAHAEQIKELLDKC